ncbi:MAG TPA: pyridoxamine 5'-phosphate oxidase family protein [Acidimicrobiales bacterium]
MGKTFDLIDDQLSEWLVSQPVFFIATAPLGADGLLNCSPKGNRQEFAVLGPRTVAYLDQTGSGVETIAHLKENGRIVVMFCAFVGPPRIVRLHGEGRVVLKESPEFEALASHFPKAQGVGVRSVIVVELERISDSCGYGVPFMEFEGHRPTMDQWSTRKGLSGIRAYWAEKNRRSINDLEGFDAQSADLEVPLLGL